MNHKEIASQLSQTFPSEVIFTITMETVMSAIVRRLGVEALTLSPDDLRLAREEVQIAIDHNLDERDFIDIGLDAWEIVRKL
ncbi:MAG: hypothetical protein KJ900_08655 [Proteobacteria bacterium]|jgi:hypothetical protein|nr:hypothetical protein [Desulfocapsa sp.]MBU3945565.1 hypothetical protein [Pseudomonadota bacterium]MCG2742982.1 hypothetical protein [Desulfobacteraceae bacterium]MBU3982798.1 hypothetical protein [Pseudomonadota bacterium]MBU4030416.1 hypothetical protein [Pseudomonadota bacterium]